MAPKNVLCMVLGHKWKRQQRPDHTLQLTCRRCGTVDVLSKDMGGLG